MSLAAGTRLGPYEVLSPLGAGGMGKVYRARDTRLDRDVALKALPAELVSDPDRLGRFTREAKLLAQLSHPNVAAVYAVEEYGGQRFLAMELADGEDLSERIRRGPVPLDEALPVATQIAEALEAAHEKGIVHRDLKPANVKVSRDGKVKLLDFGLARSWAEEPGPSSDATHSPTLSARATAAGMILGTAAYMSPEQARGRPVDKRADVWAFGVVLYEMLTGRRLFDGETVTDVLAGVLKTEPDWNALPPGTPPAVVRVLKRCLERDPRQRLHDIADARLELADVRPEGPTTGLDEGGRRAAAPRRFRPAPRELVAWTAALLLAAVSFALWRRAPAEPGGTRGLVRASLASPEGLAFATGGGDPHGPAALSPDGRLLVLPAASRNGRVQLWIVPWTRRSLAPSPGPRTRRTPSGRPIAGRSPSSRGASSRRWSGRAGPR